MSRLFIEEQVLGARIAKVFLFERLAGILSMEAPDEYSFQYDQEYLRGGGPPISLSLPLRSEPYQCETLHPYFDNLLFEGEQLRLAERKYGLSRSSNVDRFKLLMVVGNSNLSHVAVLPIVNQEVLDLSSKFTLNGDTRRCNFS